MNVYRKQVEEAIRATVFLSRSSYLWFGKQSWPLSSKVKRALTPQTARNYLLFNLQHQLYTNFYCSGVATPAERQIVAKPVTGRTPFVEALGAANLGDGYWDEGWQVRSIEDGRIVVQKEALELWVHQEHCRIAESRQIVPNMRLDLRFPKDFHSLSPGFYMALSNTALTRQDFQELVRFYWNLTPEGAVHLMHTTTGLLNQANLPFRLKVLNDPQQFTRCDAAVLYIERSNYDAVANILSRVYAAVEPHLRQTIPAFTKGLAPGLGLAEDPGPGQTSSFGEHRCQLLAEGMLQAYEQGKKSVAERLRVVEDCFEEVGISLEQPFLNPGSRDIYSFHSRYDGKEPGQSWARQPQKASLSRDVSQARSSVYSRDDPCDRPAHGCLTPFISAFLQTALSIGRQLVQEAIWHEDQCNWLGMGQRIYSPAKDLSSPTIYRALEPELYDGTSGIALFLAELSALTGETPFRQTALGAIRQALCHLDAIPPSNRLGLYTGWIGIALTAARIGTLLGEEKLLSESIQLLGRTQREKPGEYEFDLIYGNAGAIAALLLLRDILADASLLDFAVQLGDELLHRADRSERGYSWKALAFATQHNLTGFSHGAAGAAYALLELFQATGEAKYRGAAEAAFDYERYWFNADVDNWPDLREDLFSHNRRKRGKQPFPSMTFWCHGAPGIALSRLRAYDILNEERYKIEAVTALHTTQKAVETALHTGMDNFSLCHGLAGNADILLEGYRALGQEWDHGALLAEKVATFGIDTYAVPRKQWPCGISGGSTPGLFLGLAGIGYFYLRLYRPSTPSILLAQRERSVAHP